MGQNRRTACFCPKPACPSGIHNTHVYTSVPTSEVKGHCFRPSDVLLLQQSLPSDGGRPRTHSPRPGGGDGSLTSAAAAAKSPQSCPTLCDPRDSSPPGSPIPGILQARTLEWAATFFSTLTSRTHIFGHVTHILTHP